MLAVTTDDGRPLCARCHVADRPWSRMRGLLGRRSLSTGEGLLLRPAGSIHMWFMRFAIDAVFLDSDGVVLDVRPGLSPWRVAARRGARQVLELPAGSVAAAGVTAGMRLRMAAPGT